MVRDYILRFPKPELGDAIQYLPLCRYCVWKYHVEGGNAVGCYYKDALAEVVDIPYLSPSGFSQSDEIRVEYSFANGSVT